MKAIDRNGVIYEDEPERLLRDIYSSKISRGCMSVMTSGLVDKAAFILANSKASSAFIDTFADKTGIDRFDYESREYTSLEDFAERRIKHGRRLIDKAENTLVSPCDGRVSVYDIAESDMFVVRNSVYSVGELLRDSKLSKKYSGGKAIVIRMSSGDYRRYIYPCSGIKSHDRRINGIHGLLHPVVNEYTPVFTENMRTYCMLRTKGFGDVIQMELGSCDNRLPGCTQIVKGDEKGFMRIGGAAVILLTEKGKAEVCEDLRENTRRGMETRLRLGETIMYSIGEV